MFNDQLAVIDSASTISAVSQEFADTNRIRPDENNSNSVRCVINCSSGKTIRPKATFNAMIRLRSGHKLSTTIYLLPTLPVPFLIGLDVLTKLPNTTVNWKTGQMNLDEVMLLQTDMTDSCDGSPSESSVVEDVEIPSKIFNDTILSSDQQKTLGRVFQRRPEVFLSRQKTKGVPFTATLPLRDPEAGPSYQTERPVPLHLRDRVRKEIARWLSEGIIEKGHSQYNSALTVVEKPLKSGEKERRVRVCLDFRHLNDRLQSDPIVNTPANLLQLEQGPHVYRSSLDLPEAYLQVRINETDKHKTAFVFEGQQYQFVYMPFGLKNSGSAFVRLVTHMIGDMDRNKVKAFIDDILVTTETFEEHVTLMSELVDRIADSGFRLSFDKMELCKRKLKFLGLVMSIQGFEVNDEKIEAIQKIDTLKSKSDVKSFLGLVLFWSKFIKDTVSKTINLTESLRSRQFTFTPKMKEEMEIIKSELCQTPILAYLDRRDGAGQLMLYTDASDMGAASHLTQEQQGRERTISYASRKFSDTERRYSIYKRELYAVLIAIRKFYHVLTGTNFILIVDNAAVAGTLSPKTKTIKAPPASEAGVIARWVEEIGRYDFDVRTVKSEDNPVADALSRLVDNDIQHQSLILQARDERPTETSDEEDVNIKRIDIAGALQQAHDLNGHPAFFQTLKKFRSMIRMPGDRKLIKDHVASCKFCLRYRPCSIGGRKSNLTLRERPDVPFEHVQIDISPVKTTKNGYNSVLGILCLFSNYLEAFPIRNKTAATVERILHNWLCRNGLACRAITTDQGTEFEGVCRDMLRDRGITVHKATAYHNNKNAGVERAFRSLKEALSAVMYETGKSFETCLPRALEIYNTRQQMDMGMSPQTAAFGTHERTNANDFMTIIDRQERLKKKREKKEEENMEPTFKYEIGQKIMIQRPPRSENGLSAKYGARFIGPATVIERVNAAVYIAEMDNQEIRVHIRQTKPFLEARRETTVVLEQDNITRTIQQPDTMTTTLRIMASDSEDDIKEPNFNSTTKLDNSPVKKEEKPPKSNLTAKIEPGSANYQELSHGKQTEMDMVTLGDLDHSREVSDEPNSPNESANQESEENRTNELTLGQPASEDQEVDEKSEAEATGVSNPGQDDREDDLSWVDRMNEILNYSPEWLEQSTRGFALPTVSSGSEDEQNLPGWEDKQTYTHLRPRKKTTTEQDDGIDDVGTRPETGMEVHQNLPNVPEQASESRYPKRTTREVQKMQIDPNKKSYGTESSL